jgi:hypothetical protein
MGQGSSGEWFAIDYLANVWQVGAIAWRTRFNNDAYYVRPSPAIVSRCEHDVTLAPGIRGSLKTLIGRISVQYASADRLNAFFQNPGLCKQPGPGVDRRNGTFSVGFVAGP